MQSQQADTTDSGKRRSGISELKRRVFSVIKDQSDTMAGRVFTVFMSVLILVNVAFVLFDTLSHEPGILKTSARPVEVVSVAIFTAEYLLRLWTADLLYPESTPARARLRYVMSGMAIVDLLSILPFYLPGSLDLRILRILRLVRLVRVFKLGRYNTAMGIVGRVLKRAAPALVSAISVIFLMVIVWAVLMYYVENDAQPEQFTSAFQGLWWAISTITTVGYGDITPVTVLGKILGAMIELSGVALVAIPTGIVSAEYMNELDREPETVQDNKPQPVELLVQLKAMMDDGLLTRNEFETCKAEVILSTIGHNRTDIGTSEGPI